MAEEDEESSNMLFNLVPSPFPKTGERGVKGERIAVPRGRGAVVYGGTVKRNGKWLGLTIRLIEQERDTAPAVQTPSEPLSQGQEDVVALIEGDDAPSDAVVPSQPSGVTPVTPVAVGSSDDDDEDGASRDDSDDEDDEDSAEAVVADWRRGINTMVLPSGTPQWVRDLRFLIFNVYSVTGDLNFLRMARFPRGISALVYRESRGNPNAVNRNEPPAPNDPRRNPPRRRSYGWFQIIDTNGRSLYSDRSLVGSLSSGMRRPPTVEFDAGDPAWQPVLTGESGKLYGMVMLRKFSRFLGAFFDAESAIVLDRLVPLDPSNADASAVANFYNGLDAPEGFANVDALMRTWWGSSSLRGVANRVRSGDAADSVRRVFSSAEGVDFLEALP